MPPTTPQSGSATDKCVEREQPPRPVHTNHALHPPAVIPAPPSVIPAQAGTTHQARPAPIPTPRLRRPRPLRHTCPFPSFLRRQEPRRSPTPALAASISPRPPPTRHPRPFPNSSLPPTRGEVRWGVGSHEPTHQARPAPITTPHLHRPRPLRRTYALPPSYLRPLPSFLRRQEPPTRHLRPSPIHPSPY